MVKVAERGGPYDRANEELRRMFRAEACILIVVNGDDGTGVSMSMPEAMRAHLPTLFRQVGIEIETALIAEQTALFCPVCSTALSIDPGQKMDHRNRPRPGALTVCVRCTAFITLDAPNVWRVVTEDEIAEMDDEVRMRLTRMRREIEQGGGH